MLETRLKRDASSQGRAIRAKPRREDAEILDRPPDALRGLKSDGEKMSKNHCTLGAQTPSERDDQYRQLKAAAIRQIRKWPPARRKAWWAKQSPSRRLMFETWAKETGA